LKVTSESFSLFPYGFDVKKYCLLLGLAAIAGLTVGWSMNHYRYGYRIPRLGPITMDGTVTAVNAVESSLPLGLAKAEMISDPVHDFGVAEPGVEGEHTFMIKNAGNQPLTLRVGATTCTCTLGSLDKNSLAPGEQTEVLLSWTVKSDSSEFSQSAQLHTNDPHQPVIDLVVKGRIVREIEIVPKTWAFGEVASSEPIELTSRVYNYMNHDIEVTEMSFSSEEMTALADFHVEAYQPSEQEDAEHAAARQAFRLKVVVQPGLKQGSISQNFLFHFRKAESVVDSKAADGEQPDSGYIVAATTGRIVGPLSMIETPKLKGIEGGGYLYDFGRLGKEDSLVAKTFVVLKGSQRENTTLTIGDTEPKGVLEATLGQPMGRGSMTLYPLELKLVLGEKPIERLGQSRDDFGRVWIESNHPEVPKMQIGVMFAIPRQSGPRASE